MADIQDTDKFIVYRSPQNYQTPYTELKKYLTSFPSGSTCLFFQHSAPKDWVQKLDGKYNQATVRIVTGNGGGSGGSQNFTAVYKTWDAPVPAHGHGVSGGTHTHTLGVSHKHSITDPTHSHSTRGLMATHDHDMRGPNGTGTQANQAGGSGNPWQSWEGHHGRDLVSDPAPGGFSSIQSAGTGMSVNNAKATLTFGNGKVNISKTVGSTGTGIGTTMDFNILYNKSIVCVKS